jgi:hypothetical protein
VARAADEGGAALEQGKGAGKRRRLPPPGEDAASGVDSRRERRWGQGELHLLRWPSTHYYKSEDS